MLKCECELRALTDSAFGGYLYAVAVGYFLCYGKTETRAGFVVFAARFIEALKDIGQLVGFNAAAVVPYVYLVFHKQHIDLAVFF